MDLEAEIEELSNNLREKDIELAKCKKQLDIASHLIKELKEHNRELWKDTNEKH